MRRFVRDNSLSLVFGSLFLVALGLQSLAGWHEYNAEQTAHHAAEVAWSTYVSSSYSGVAVLENWQSEYLQFTLFILLTVWLVQRGSPESKELGKAGTEKRPHATDRPARRARLAAVGARRRVRSSYIQSTGKQKTQTCGRHHANGTFESRRFSRRAASPSARRTPPRSGCPDREALRAA
jgi:hypothetical protein